MRNPFTNILPVSRQDLLNQNSEALVLVSGACGFLIHLGFIGLFVLLEIPSMVALNVLSCFYWLFIIWLAVHSKSGIAVHLATVEVIAHAVLATLLLGPNFGFHFYLWPVTILSALNPSIKFASSVLISVMTMVVFGCLSTFVMTDLTAEYANIIVNTIFFINILIAGFSMILTGMLIRRLFSRQRKVLQEYAHTDELTQLFNRRHVMVFLQHLEANRRRTQMPYSVCLCDLDHFKSVNDQYGHDVGDTVLIEFSAFLKHAVRKSDCVARWGGEEFMVILSNTNGKNAFYTMNNLLHKLRTENCITFGDNRQLSVSVGVAQAQDELSVDEIVIRADQALYRAKEAGRDRVELFRADH